MLTEVNQHTKNIDYLIWKDLLPYEEYKLNQAINNQSNNFEVLSLKFVYSFHQEFKSLKTHLAFQTMLKSSKRFNFL